MVKHGHDGIEVTPARFVVYPWLGTSPDAWVNDHPLWAIRELQNIHAHIQRYLACRFLLFTR